MTDPREEKLPQWARKLLAKERFRANSAERKLAEHLDTVEKSRIWYGDFNNPIYVPDMNGYQTVHFSLTGKQGVMDEIAVTIKDDALEIQGGTSVSLELQSSNYFRVRHCDWRVRR